MEGLRPRLSRRKLLVRTSAGIAAAILPEIARADTPVISIVDTVSGPNFQAFWNTYLIPEIKKQLGVDVKYTVGSGPTLLLQMKSWAQNQPGFSLLFLKDLDLSNAVRTGIELESLYPAHAKEIPNAADIPPEFLATSEGVQLNGDGLIFWRSIRPDLQLGLRETAAEDLEGVLRPPQGVRWAYRPDPPRRRIGRRACLHLQFPRGLGVDFSKPFSEIQTSPAWKSAWDAFSEFSKSFAQPVASSAPVLFHQFQTEQVWMTSYAQDYSLWSTTQGQLPPTAKASPLDVNIIGASHAFLAVPKVDSDAQKETAYKVINLLLSPEVQLHMLETMYQYPGTNAWKQAPASVWEKIPRVDQAESRSIRISNLDAVNYIQQHGMDYIAH